MRSMLVLATVLGLLGFGTASADEWPQFRGGTAQSVAPLATVPAVQWRWQLAPTTSGLWVIESLAWLPLALGLLGCSGAGLP